MIIAFDVNPLVGFKTGVGIYSYNLIKNLRIKCPDSTFKYYSYSLKGGYRGNELPEDLLNKHYSLKASQKILFHLWKYLQIPKLESIIGRTDIVHGLFHNIPPTKLAKKVVTIYDLTSFIYPEFHTKSSNEFHRKAIEFSVKKADAVVAISHSTKVDIVNLLRVSPDKIFVVYPSYDNDIFKPTTDHEKNEELKAKYSIDKKYVLYLGTLEPRKNIDKLVDAFLNANMEMGNRYQLVLGGSMGWMVEKLIAKIKSENSITLTGPLSIDEYVTILQGASCMVYPSIYEGFGIPILEAMACGIPVITSNTSSMPEVAGDAGVLIDPQNTKKLESAIMRVLDNEKLRQEMREKGLKQAENFSWERSAEKCAGLYKDLLGAE